jgi:hypothetical protein
MLRRTAIATESWRAHYHRVRQPRTLAVHRLRERLELQKAREVAKAKGEGAPSVPTVPYRYNRWWVGDNAAFVHQTHVIEDPETIMRRRASLPEPTAADKWKKPMNPFFEPLKPFVDVVDYPKDPDVKFMKPATIPRWKDFMARDKPMVPRTWY